MSIQDIEKARIKYLVQQYQPDGLCKDANYACDYRPVDEEKCPCQFAQEYGWEKPIITEREDE